MPLRAPQKIYGNSLGGGYRGLGVISTVKQEAADLERLFGTRILGGTAHISMGRGGVSIHPASAGLLNVVPKFTGSVATHDLPQIDRRDQPQNEEVVSVSDITQYTYLINGKHYKGTLRFLRTLAIEQGDLAAQARIEAQMKRDQVPVPVPILPTTTPGGDDMDLGTLAVDLLRQAGTAYIQRELAPRGYAPQVTPALFDVEPDIPFVDIVRTQKKCKRRRRMIVTPSEISQLASLKAVATPSEVKLFLAKRLRN